MALAPAVNRMARKGMQVRVLPLQPSLLPTRSTVGQLPLEQHIGVRIPGGQPRLLRNARSSNGSDLRFWIE